MKGTAFFYFFLLIYITINFGFINYSQPDPVFLSPLWLAIKEDKMFVAYHTNDEIGVFSKKDLKLIERFPVKGKPMGICLDKSSQKGFIISGEDSGFLKVIDTKNLNSLKEISIGHSPLAPVTSDRDNRLYFLSRFKGTLASVDLASWRIQEHLTLPREPIDMCFSSDYSMLFIIHHIPDEPSLADHVSADVSIVDVENMSIKKRISLPNGSTGARDITITNDGKWILIPHLIAHYQLPTTQLERGWMNTNAVSIINAELLSLHTTILLDEIDNGMANPWGVKFTEDDRYVIITHSGNNEVSIINWPAILNRIKNQQKSSSNYQTTPDITLGMLGGLRQKVKLKGIGPRELLIDKDQIYIANYFSEDIEIIDINNPESGRIIIPVNEKVDLTYERQGEILFHSSLQCFQKWQSCASCHPDGRADGLNWDIMNDGFGNPKNTKSMLHSHVTPPVTWTGIRPDAETSVRAGFRHIQFFDISENNASYVDAYLKSLRPIKSPYRDKKAMAKGKKVFEKVGCAKCHNSIYYTDMKSYDLGTHNEFDYTTTATGVRQAQTEFDTPALQEVWRSAPFLHDGRYMTLEKLFIEGNHGHVSELSSNELILLIDYVKTL